MSRLFMGCTFRGDFVRGYAKARLASEFGITMSYGQYELNGMQFFLGRHEEVEGYLNYDTKKQKYVNKAKFDRVSFEAHFDKEIKREMAYKLDALVREENRKLKKLESMKTFVTERNKRNVNLKKTPSYFQSKFMNKYYIYNAGIHQIVNVHTHHGFHYLRVELPSGRLTDVPLTTAELKEREKELFVRRKDAQKYLVETWINENEVPKFRDEYIDALVKDLFKV